MLPCGILGLVALASSLLPIKMNGTMMGSHERRFLEKSTSPPVKGDSRNGTQLFWVPPSHCDKVHQGLGYQVSSTKPVPQLFFPQGMALFTSKPTEGRI